MSHTETDKVFAGSIPELYDRYLVPLIFEPYAVDLARRVASRPPGRVLEIAAGTGVVTRALASALPASASIVATDLNQPMLDRAASVGTARPVQWQTADAMSLPFDDASFDAVVCQFGVMFFPDKARAFSEARRVLRPGGAYLFNVWDGIEENDFADVATKTLGEMFPADPPLFMARTPHGHHDRGALERSLKAGGFTQAPAFDTVAARSRAASARDVAIAYCQGTPLRNEIETRGPGRLAEATDRVTTAVERQFGAGPVDGKIRAHIVTIGR